MSKVYIPPVTAYSLLTDLFRNLFPNAYWFKIEIRERGGNEHTIEYGDKQ